MDMENHFGESYISLFKKLCLYSQQLHPTDCNQVWLWSLSWMFDVWFLYISSFLHTKPPRAAMTTETMAKWLTTFLFGNDYSRNFLIKQKEGWGGLLSICGRLKCLRPEEFQQKARGGRFQEVHSSSPVLLTWHWNACSAGRLRVLRKRNTLPLVLLSAV